LFYLIARLSDTIRQSTNELRESEERLRLLLKNSSDSLVIINADGSQRYLSPAAEKITGFPVTELEGKTLDALIHPDDLMNISMAWKEAVEHPEKTVTVQCRHIHKVKGWVLTEAIAQSFLAEPAINGIIASVRDITERQVLEKSLADSEERYRRLVEISPDSVFIHSHGKFVFMNASAARLLGAQRPEELYGRKALDFVHPSQKDMVSNRIQNAQSGGYNLRIEMLLIRLDGTTVPVEMESVQFTHQGIASVLSIARDISEREKMQDELIKAQKLESLGILAGGIAHDFNNILTGIMGNVSLARMQLAPSNNVSECLVSCEKAAVRATELTRQLLTFARGGAPIKKLLNPDLLIRESAAFILHGSNVSCELELPEDLWHIEADAGQLSQVLHNILINAIQAIPSGGVIKISAKNETMKAMNSRNLQAGNYLLIVIEDRGCGIPPENLPRIFDPYFTTKSDGNGLGLASAYSITKRHGGMIWMSSTEGIGSTVTIALPAVFEKISDHGTRKVTSKLTGSGRILVMDDEKIIREMARDILEFAGYQVEICANGKETIERYREAYEKNNRFDAVILDLTVPGGMGGRDAAGLILEIDPEALLVVSSGYSNDPVVANYLQYGFQGAIVKPFSADSLAGEIQRLIEISH
jgi:PAS domain S-box-containing protein